MAGETYDPKDSTHDYSIQLYYEDQEWIAEALGGDDEHPLAKMVGAPTVEDALSGLVEILAEHVRTGVGGLDIPSSEG